MRARLSIRLMPARRRAGLLLALALLWGGAPASARGQGAARLGALPLAVPRAAVPASFDCGKATRAVDRFLCANAALRWQDLALSRSYRAARDARTGPARAALVAEQRDWLGERDRRCVADRSFAELAAASSPLGGQARACLMTVYLDRRRALGDRIAAPVATRRTTELDLRPIARARPELVEEGQVRIAAMRLSPDGSHIAILLPSQEIDLPDQMWLYRIADRRLVPVTPRPDRQARHPADTVSAITALAWRGGRVFALASLWGEGGDGEQGPTALYTATADGARRLPKAPGDIEGHFESIGGGLVVRDDELPEDEAATLSMRGNARYLVWTADRGHATIDLHIRARAPLGPPYLVAWGGWDLAPFLFDAAWSRLVYSADTGIALFDMATRGERRIAGTARGDRPYAVTPGLDTLLWSTRHRCGGESLAAPDEAAPERFCIAALADTGR